MFESSVLLNFVIAIGLGALIGLEREVELQKNHLTDFGGFRTFILISFFGGLTGYLTTTVFNSVLLLGVVSFGFFLLAIVGYIITGYHFKRVGSTTELTSIISFFLGLLCTIGMVKLAVVFTVFVVIVLALKPSLHQFAKRIEYTELSATLKFALISLVILPFLPNVNYSLLDIPYLNNMLLNLGLSNQLLGALNVFNPYNIWLMVVFITGISFIGYILIKIYGVSRGLGITGFLGGLVSSTSVTFALSMQSKKRTSMDHLLLVGILISSSTMLLRILFIILILSPALFKTLIIPLGLMMIAGFVNAYFALKDHTTKKYPLTVSTPFALAPALKFTLFFIVILLLSKLGSILYGSIGVYVVSAISGTTELNAITLSIVSLLKNVHISASVAATSITIAVMINTAMKAVIPYFFGSQSFAEKALKSFALVIFVGVLGMLMM
ncbi:MgtC/SapB family protein [Candidatus Woesearchaeota archaeon]|nr:MgtC/SapB family protein [Candidatus Woesearchaeota archaeon]